MTSKKIILIEDDLSLKNAIESFLKRLKYDVISCEDVETAVKQISNQCDLILSDLMMPGLSGFDLVKFVRRKFPNVPIILMTAFGSIEKAVEAMKSGVYDFLVKPFSLNVLETAINSVFLDRQAAMANGNLLNREPLTASVMRVGIRRLNERFISNDKEMAEIIENLKRIAPSKATVLIQGESGTGKELVAKMIHDFSPRASRIFVAINCAAMPDTLLESELFGHEKGSFTGAINRQIGKFELSNNGTILLDEISEMSLTMQTKLLRVLQECEIYRVGGVKSVPLNLRVIATTNRDLYQYMKEGHFREDLYYRLNVIPILLPPLRERGEDVLLLAKDFLEEFSVLHGKKPMTLDSQAKEMILTHSWHGNVRELRNAMERAVLVGSFDVIEEVGIDSPSRLMNHSESSLFEPGMKLNEVEKRVIVSTLDFCGGNKTKTAGVLGISLRTLRNKLKSYGITNGLDP